MFRFETLISVTLEVSAPSLSPAGLLLCVERPVDRSRCLWRVGGDVFVSPLRRVCVGLWSVWKRQLLTAHATASRRVACESAHSF